MSDFNGNGTGQLLPPRRTLTLRDAAEAAPAPSGVGAWADRLRAAAYDAVKESDIQEVIQAQLVKAKAGDQKAAKFVLDFLTGGAPKVQLQKVVVYKQSRTVQRQAKPRPGERHNPDLDDAMEARPTAAPVEAGPSVRVLRRLAALFLHANGPCPGPGLAAELEVSAEELETVLECEWFALTAGKWTLTPEGRQHV